MSLLDTIAILLSAAALLSFVNHRYVGLPATIGLMLIALLISLAMIALGALGVVSVAEIAAGFVAAVDFNAVVMNGMLSFLLFAGALHVDLDDLFAQRWIVAILATAGTFISALLISGGFWLLTRALGFDLAFIYCLLFGALISPTDPIAVLGILKSVGAPRELEIKIAGESLFNDGVGVVLFSVLLGIAVSGEVPAWTDTAALFAREALGGVVFGLLLGMIAFWMLRQVDDHSVEVLITLALVSGGHALALALHTSGPLAMVAAGLLIGNHGRRFAMSEHTREHLDRFWELVDEILNAVLFTLLGFELIVLAFGVDRLLAGVAAVPLVLLARAVCVAVPVHLLRMRREFSAGVVKILTWGGLRGGISVALALALPPGPERDLILTVTYVVVVFSIMVQGLTVGRLIRSQSA